MAGVEAYRCYHLGYCRSGVLPRHSAGIDCMFIYTCATSLLFKNHEIVILFGRIWRMVVWVLGWLVTCTGYLAIDRLDSVNKNL